MTYTSLIIIIVKIQCILYCYSIDYIPRYINVNQLHARLANSVCKHPSLEERVRQADLIFTATVTQVINESNSSNIHSFELSIKRIIKSSNNDKFERTVQVDVRGREASIFCQLGARQGDTRIFFVRLQHALLLQSIERINFKIIMQIEEFIGNRIDISPTLYLQHVLTLKDFVYTSIPTINRLSKQLYSDKTSKMNHILTKFDLTNRSNSILFTQVANNIINDTKILSEQNFLKQSSKSSILNLPILTTLPPYNNSSQLQYTLQTKLLSPTQSFYQKINSIESSSHKSIPISKPTLFSNIVTQFENINTILNNNEITSKRLKINKHKIIPQVFPVTKSLSTIHLFESSSTKLTTNITHSLNVVTKLYTINYTTLDNTYFNKTTSFKIKKYLSKQKLPLHLGSIVLPPGNQTILMNSSALFTCHVSGLNPTIYWLVNESRWRGPMNLQPKLTTTLMLTTSSTTKVRDVRIFASVLRLRGSQIGLSTVACAVVSHNYQPVFAYAFLNVIKDSKEIDFFPKFGFVNNNVSMLIGANSLLTCESIQPAAILWYRNNALLKNNKHRINIYNNSLEILNASQSDAGFYECRLQNEAGTISKFIKVNVHKDVCKNVVCLFYAHCQPDSNMEAKCVCPNNCSTENLSPDPVCASDNMTYDNQCSLRIHACQSQLSLSVLNYGKCIVKDPCLDTECLFHSVCISEDGIAKCHCPTSCSNVTQSPLVCASDGKEYKNECLVIQTSCHLQKPLQVLYQGTCDPCYNVTCESDAICVEGECRCQEDCGDLPLEPVCADDGSTYDSLCHLAFINCQLGTRIHVLHQGECVEASGSGEIGIVENMKEQCTPTNCGLGGKCVYQSSGQSACVCNFTCPAIRNNVCASDGRNYGNECQMHLESCRKQKKLFIQNRESCEDIEEEFCDGQLPLINIISNREYNCPSEKCPSGSYCHLRAGSGKCCREELFGSLQHCVMNPFGCCADNITSALGPQQTGCPEKCRCNRLGSTLMTCDPITMQCTCRPAVSGLRCDRCNSTHWGLHSKHGCIPCNCNIFGSIRLDCDQMTGRCMCLPGLQGDKCDVCPNRKKLSDFGCTDDFPNERDSCASLECKFGAICKITDSKMMAAECICPTSVCRLDSEQTGFVCASNGRTYQSLCHMKQDSCLNQISLTALSYGPCSSNNKNLMKGDGRWTGSAVALRPRSYIQLRKPNLLALDFEQNSFLSLAIQLRPEHQDGLILYFGHPSGRGNFLSLALIDGYIEFRMDLGAQRVHLQRAERVMLGEWLRVEVIISATQALLTIDDLQPIAKPFVGSLTSLNAANRIHVGYVENVILRRNSGVMKGFEGCVKHLTIKNNQNTFSFRFDDQYNSDILKYHHIGATCERFN